MSKSALASITAQYTDSENEDDHEDESAESQNSQVIIPRAATPVRTPEDARPATASNKKRRRKKSVRRLVSYQDDTIISDDEDDRAASTSDESESDQENEAAASTSNNFNAHRDNGTPMEVDDGDESCGSVKEVKMQSKSERSIKYTHYGFTLPAEPRGKPTPELVEKIRNLYAKMDTNNMDMNRIIQERKDFRNPSIYEKLIQFCDINEFGTNYPPEIYDPLQWGAESYYEELARVQKNEMLKRQKDRKETDKIEQATALARKVEEEAKKRKSKWDQPASAKPVVPPALTTTVTGTKGTVISAFGSLPKKPPA